MLAKLRATDIDEVRQVANMPIEEADRCVKADNPAAACNAWLARAAAETRDTEDASMNSAEGLQHSAAENDTSDTDADEAPAAEQEEAAESGGDDMQSVDLDALPPAREPVVDGDGDAVVADVPDSAPAASPLVPAVAPEETREEPDSSNEGTPADVPPVAGGLGGDDVAEPAPAMASFREALDVIRRTLPQLDHGELRDLAGQIESQSGAVVKEARDLADEKESAGRIAAEKRARAAMRSNRGRGKLHGLEDGGRDAVPTDSAPAFPLDAPPSDEDDGDAPPPKPQSFEPPPPPPPIVFTAEEATRLRQPGCDVVRKLYGEIAGSMGFDAAVVSAKIKATFADFSKSQIRNAGTPAHYNDIKEKLCRSLLAR